MQTRETISEAPDGSRVIFTQRLLPDGCWHNVSARHHAMSTATIVSGSHQSHASKSASASKRWTRCTASVAFEAANQDKVFTNALGRVRDLVPYLLTIEDELHEHEVRAIEIVRLLDAGELKVSRLTDDQKEDISRSEGSVPSREGTRAHDFAAAIFDGSKTVKDIPEEFQEQVGNYVEHCLSLVGDGEPLIESRVPLWYDPTERGTTDFTVYNPTLETIFVRDLKWGVGVLEHNIENSQLAIYARSVVEDIESEGFTEFAPDTIVNIAVFQPRHREAPDIKPWITTLADLRAFTKEIEEAAAIIDSGEGLVFEPSDEAWCRSFCPCKGFCAARLKFATEAWENPNSISSAAELLAMLPDDDEIPGHKPRTKTALTKLEPEERIEKRVQYVAGLVSESMDWALDVQTLVRFWAKKKIITSMLDDVGDYLRDRMLAGDPEVAEFLKMVESKEGNRAWVNEAAAEKLLKQKLKIDDYKPRELISVTEAQKLIDFETASTKFKNLFNGLVGRSAAGKTIALLSDKRPAIANAIDLLPEDDEPDSFEDVVTSAIGMLDPEIEEDDGFGDNE